MSDLSPRALPRALLGVGWLVMALSMAARDWLMPLGPALMLALPLKVIGLSPTAANAVARRNNADRACRRTTNPFFPGPPRPDAQGTDR